LDVLEDDKIDDGTDQTKNYQFSETPQRTNTDRFWFRMKHNQDFDHGVTAKLDIDVVSDEDYLQEFKDGFTGFTETNDYFDKEVGRSLDEYDDTLRKNWLNINKSWSTYAFNVDAAWYDNIYARRQDTADTTLQTLPSIQFDAAKEKIGASKFYYSLDSEYRSFYRQDTTSTLVNGQRTDVYPKIYLPIKLGNYVHFEPSIGIRQTIWHTHNFTDINGDSDSLRTRQMYDMGAQLSTKLTRIFNPNTAFADKIQHEIIPEIDYIFTPNIRQDDLPEFDDLDRIEQQNLITWSLIQNFTSRTSGLTPEGKEVITYHDFAYIKLYQSYDINKERNHESQPFSDIALDAELPLTDFIRVDMDLSWSPYNNRFNSFNIGNTLKDNRGDQLRTEYRYDSHLSESLYARINVTLTDEFTAYSSIEKNLKENNTVETQAGLSLKKSCWTFRLYFSDSQDEQSITFLINLHGIGELDTK
ncbi:MAG: LPS assembly protein LptD, partial [Desulfobacula sp.]|nr:LPS assembly protein LptD [Desulfobacula sp.]